MFRLGLIMMTVGNEPAILVLQDVAMASRALPGSKMPRLKVTIVHKVTLIVRIGIVYSLES